MPEAAHSLLLNKVRSSSLVFSRYWIYFLSIYRHIFHADLHGTPWSHTYQIIGSYWNSCFRSSLKSRILILLGIDSSLDSVGTFGTGCGRKHIGFVSSFKSKSNGSVFEVPSFPLKKSLNFCNNFSISWHCVRIKYWHWVSITFCKSAFSYLEYNIKHNCFVALWICFHSYTSLT